MPHYTLEEKRKRNADLVEMVNNHPDLSFREIGALQKPPISGARAWVIYKRCKGK